MPRVSQFYGIAIYLYYRDHAPPHFHAIYGDHEAVFEIATGAVIAGRLPPAGAGTRRGLGGRPAGRVATGLGLGVASQPLPPVPPLD